MEPKISVIIPIYNVEKWLRECLDSVCAQSLREIEIICINDGSPDHSLQILHEYASRDNRIIIIDKENEGVGAARNDGIKVAKGNYIAFMDPDDKYPDANTLEILYDAVCKNNVLVAGGYFGCMNDKSERIPKSRSYFDVDFTCVGLTNYRDYQCDYQFQAFIFSRALIVENSLLFPLYARFQDPPFFVRVMNMAEVFYAVNEMTYLYRTSETKPRLSLRKASDLLSGLSDNLQFSKDQNLGRLHYITAMRFLSDATYITEYLQNEKDYPELLWHYIKTAALIDEKLIEHSGFEISQPILPKLFIHLLEDSRKYRKLMQHRSIRLYAKLTRK